MDVATLFSLREKTALVTGGSRGIGRMIAEAYLRAGATVFISARKPDACERAADELGALGTCVPLPADVSQESGRAALVAAIRNYTSQLDILVNNAGTNWAAPYAEYPVDGFRKVLDLNVSAVFFMTRELTALLEVSAREGDPGRVINVGSMDGLQVPTILPGGTFAYSASKAAVHHLTRTLAVELAPKRITVNAIAPGYFESKMTAHVLRDHRETIESACPLRRIGAPEDMAGVAIYLASRAGAFTTGTVIPIDGGTSLT
jgi:NAD(P)-dependent dehydrogenase (short-subunit alcohol dehydrogenase family)